MLKQIAQQSLMPAFKLLAGVCLVLWPFLYVTVEINDDAFVYYTYAKNVVLANAFAYDPRGISSEGFTSLLYMILLVPFEAIHFPLPLAAVILNIVVILGSAKIMWEIFRLLFKEQDEKSWLAPVLFLSCLYLDKNFVGLMGWGLETILNAFVFLALVHRFLVLSELGNQRNFRCLLLLFVLSILVRPENVLVGAPWIVLGFFTLQSKKEGLKDLALFFLGIIGFVAWKYWVFRDVLPTGFYRKINSQRLDMSYLMNYFREYRFKFHLVVWSVLAASLVHTSTLKKNRNLILSIMGLVLTLCGLLAFILTVNPIQGYMQRYLLLGTALIYLCGCALAVLVIPRLKIFQAGIVSLMLLVLFGGIKQRQRNNPLVLYRETLNLLERDPYVSFGKYLQKNLSNPEQISLMFGDAGSIPYYFNCKFVDINGLTEPYLARMFREQNRKEKVSQYISKQKLDIAVLAVENGHFTLNQDSQSLPQGPLSKPSEYGYFLKSMKDDGFAYAGTIHAVFYDLHFGLNQNSPRFSELKRVMSDYVHSGKGFIKEGDLRVQFADGDVVFKNITKSFPTEEAGSTSQNL